MRTFYVRGVFALFVLGSEKSLSNLVKAYYYIFLFLLKLILLSVWSKTKLFRRQRFALESQPFSLRRRPPLDRKQSIKV